MQNPGHPDIPVYEHVLVDEYQDLNRADQALIDAISGNAAVTVIGDADQSIYGFRHANPKGIPGNARGPLRTCRSCWTGGSSRTLEHHIYGRLQTCSCSAAT
jgi:hypothetical protein